jgi:serine/threonine protein kinase
MSEKMRRSARSSLVPHSVVSEVSEMPTPGQRISEYILDAPIGAGTFGQVWRAHHHVWLDQLVAIKLPSDAQYVKNLQREGVAVHGLVHPNIVRAIGFDPFAPEPYLVMEYVPGTSLRPLIAGRKLSPEQATQVLRQVLAGLGYAHENGLVHRDIKPENILVHERAAVEGFDAPGVIKVTDFGLGKAAATTAVGSIVYSQSLEDPAAKAIAGTLEYMSPEQRQGGDVDGRSDLYACGVVLYEMLTGERPAGTDLPSDLNREVPRHLDEVFRRSYARLDKRFASAAEFAEALGGVGVPPPLPVVTKPLAAAEKHCPQCRQTVSATDQFCMYCGVQLVARVRRCAKCGAWPDVHERFCQQCGTEIQEPVLAV